MSKTALLFAGQGSQQVGMGRDLAASYAAAREVYERGSALLGFDLAQVSFHGPDDQLKRTDVAQPAIVAASLAALAVLRIRRPELSPDYCAGLSLGEYAALAAAGAMTEAEAMRLVSLRGAFMQDACEARPGAMASVLGLPPAAVEEVVAAVSTEEEPVAVANYNSPKQTVVSGSAEAVKQAVALLDERGARRVIQLAVAGAYHSPLMAPAAEKLRPHLDEARLQHPAVPVVANVTAAPHGAPSEIRELLCRQVTEPVRFEETVRYLVREGVTTFYELGPGRVLAGLLRQIDRSLTCVSLMDLESFEAAGISEVQVS